MKIYKTIQILVVTMLSAMPLSAPAQSINLWQGNETGADWNEAHKWNLKHAPTGSEAIHFRQQSSVISINSTLELENGMHLYGQELLLEGNGNINLRSPVSYQRTIAIPASSSGRANLTLTDNLSVKAQISLAAKAFGTSASKGSITLKDRSTLSGEVLIGNNGNGSGLIVLRDQATYCITRLKLDTLASHGGSAEIHILGGTVRLAVGDDPFEIFLADASRKIILGKYGTLYVESDMPIELKKKQLEKMISQKQIISVSGCELGTPIIRDGMLSLKTADAITAPRPKALLATDATNSPQLASAQPPADSNTDVHPAGYIVFFSALLLLVLRPVGPDALVAHKGDAQPTADQSERAAKTNGSKYRKEAA